jgi:adenylyl- and sulfurtransferase ThiI
MEFGNRIALVSVMNVNNETGMIQPINEIQNILKSKSTNVVFHSDIAQGLPVFDIRKHSPEIITMSMYKLGSLPIGVLLYKEGIELSEHYFGTLDTLNIHLAGIITENYFSHLDQKIKEYCEVKRILKEKISIMFESIGIQFKDLSPIDDSTFNIQSVLLPEGYQGKMIQKRLSDKGICISTGSACSNQSKIGSHVLSSMGYSDKASFGLLRFSFDIDNMDEIDYLIDSLKEILIEMKPLINDQSVPKTTYKQIKSDIADGKDTKTVLRLDIQTDMDISDINLVYNCVKVSVGELYLKGDNKKKYVFTLRNNVKDMIPNRWGIIMQHNYLLILSQKGVPTNEEILELCNVLKNISGISKISPCFVIPNEKNRFTQIQLVRCIAKRFELSLTGDNTKFKINTTIKEMNKYFGYRSSQWNYLLGQYIVDKYKEKAVVDLNNPDLTLNVTIYEKSILVNTESFKGFQGLPSGSSGKVLCLLDSTNLIRSLVSCYRMIGRGMKVEFLILDEEMDNPEIVEVLRTIQKYQPSTKTYNIPIDGIDPRFIKKLCPALIWEPPKYINVSFFLQQIKDLQMAHGFTILHTTASEEPDELLRISAKLTKVDITGSKGRSSFYDKLISNRISEPTNLNKDVIMLLSGGIDSPVASYKLMKTGFNIKYFLHFATDIDKVDNIKEIRKHLGGGGKQFDSCRF